ncbi:hypothetical protein J6590_084613, partial [Homalodisca vitripennis]
MTIKGDLFYAALGTKFVTEVHTAGKKLATYSEKIERAHVAVAWISDQKRSACPAIGGGLKVTCKPLVPRTKTEPEATCLYLFPFLTMSYCFIDSDDTTR